MNLIAIIVVIAVAGLLLWAIETYLPMSQPIRVLLRAVTVIIIILWLLQTFGLLGSLSGVRVQ